MNLQFLRLCTWKKERKRFWLVQKLMSLCCVWWKESQNQTSPGPCKSCSSCRIFLAPPPAFTHNLFLFLDIFCIELDASMLKWSWTIVFFPPCRPTTIDSSRYQFNSDRSQLIIKSVTRSDYGDYICTAINKIAESSATITLHVFGLFMLIVRQLVSVDFGEVVLTWCLLSEAPEVFVSAEQQSVSMGERVSVSCNVSGYPYPELHWINKHNGRTVVGSQSQNNISTPSPVHELTCVWCILGCQSASSGHIHVSEGVLVIEDVVSSDGGLYSCMAVSTSGNASRDVTIYSKTAIFRQREVFANDISSFTSQPSRDLPTTCPWHQDRPRFSSHSKRCPLMEGRRSQVMFYSGNKKGTASGRRSASRFQVKYPAYEWFHSPHQ